MKNKLVVTLSINPQLLINDYIGNVENLPNGNVFIKNAKHLEICLDLLDKENYSYNRILTSKLFLEAYAIIKNKQFNKYPIAKRKLKEALQKEKKAAYIYNALGIVLNYEENYKESEKNYRKANELIPTWYFPINNLGVNYYEQTDYSFANKYFNQVLSKDFKNKNAIHNLGAVAEGLGRYQEAEYYYHQVKKQSGEYLSITLRNLGNINKRKGNIKQAEDYFLRAIEKDSKDVNALFDYAHLLIDENINPQKAITLLKKAIVLEPYLSKGYAEYASFLRRFPKDDTDLVKADSLFNIAIKNNPFYTWAYASQGWLFYKQKEDKNALDSFNKGIKNNPKKASSYYNLANFYNSGLKNKTLAKEYFEKSLQIDSFYMPAYKGLINLLNSENKFDISIEMLNKVIQRNSKAPDLYNLLGNTYYVQKKYLEAIKYYQKTIEVDSTYANGYLNLAYSQLITKDYKNAAKYFKLSAKYNPYKSKTIDFSKLFLLQARKAKRKNNLEEAKNILKQASNLDSNIETVFMQLELAYLTNELQNSINLITEFNNFSASKSWQIKRYELLVKVYLEFKNLEKARFYFTKYQKINPIPNVMLRVLLLSLEKNNKEAKELLSTVNPLLLRDTYLKRKYSNAAINILKKLQK